MTPSRDIGRLIEIMEKLRDPETGCPWDVAQDFSTIAPYTVEEAYEVAEAIARKDYEDLCDELGDLLLQPVFHARMAEEQGLFDFGDVVEAITRKLIRRHPHVFEDAPRDAASIKATWRAIKADEKAERAQRRGETSSKDDTRPGRSALDVVPSGIPALPRAQQLDAAAAKVGFDWPDLEAVADKCREEIAEVDAAAKSNDPQALTEEIGDLLFAVSSLARHVGVDAEAALIQANAKFERRFAYVERRCTENGTTVDKAGMDQLDAYWNEIRARERQSEGALDK